MWFFNVNTHKFYLHTKPLPLNRPVVNKTQADTATFIICSKNINIPNLLRQNDWFVRGIDAFAVSVCHKSQSVCKFKKCRHEKPYISLTCEMSLALVCLMTDCIMLRENLFERDVSALTERDHFHLLHIKISYDFRRHGMQQFVMLLYWFLWLVFAINTCNCTFFFFFFFTNACKPFN